MVGGVRFGQGKRFDRWLANQRMRGPFRYKHARLSNFTHCGTPLGEFSFFRTHSSGHAEWRYASEAHQDAFE